MFRSLSAAFRSIRKQRLYAVINVLGLTVGLCACLIIATVVIDDLSYDRHWKRSSDIYRIISVNKMGEGLYDRFPSSFVSLGPELKKIYPEVENYSSFSIGTIQLNPGNNESNGVTANVLNTDSAVWDLLDFRVLAGEPQIYVEGQVNLVITESFRKKIFKDKDPVGAFIRDVPAYGAAPQEYLITGIIADIPANTHLRADVIRINRRRSEALNKSQFGTFAQQYLLLKPGTNAAELSNKINRWYKSQVDVTNPYQYELQNIRNIYLDSDFAEFQPVKGSRKNVYIFSGVALLLMVIACVNYINLNTARSVTNLRDTGVRKVLGASRKQIMSIFIREALVIFTLSAVLATIIYQASLPAIELYLGHSLVRTLFSGFPLLMTTIAATIVVGFFTGLYPAWVMSGFRAAGSIKGQVFRAPAMQTFLRKSLVVLQFSISIVVLLAMLIVQQQLRFIEKADLGFNKSNLMQLGIVSWDGKGESFRNEVARIPGVTAASITSWLPSNGAGYMSREIDDPSNAGNKINIWYISGDVHLASTLGLQLQEGRLLSSDLVTDAMNEDSLRDHDPKVYKTLADTRPAIVTATTAKLLRVEALNKQLTNARVVPVGVVRDFHNQSFHEKLGPTIILGDRNPQYGAMLIRVSPGAQKQVTETLQGLWKSFFAYKLLDIGWVDEMLAAQYKSEQRLRQLFTFFSILTMALAALGIFGLVVHSAQQRVKEIGIRKVLGASVYSIVNLLSSEFVRLVLIAFLIASPIAWLLMNKWLENFSYRIDFPAWVMLLAGLVTLLAAVIPVSLQAIRAALANPVNSLRNE